MRLHWLHTTLQRQPSKVSKPNYCWFFSISPCYRHLSHFHPSTTQVSFSSSLLPPSPVFLFTHVCSKMNYTHEKRETRQNVKLFLCFLCSVLWLLSPPSKMPICFSCTTAFPVFSLCRHSSLHPFFNFGTLTLPAHHPSPNPGVSDSKNQKGIVWNWSTFLHGKKRLAKHWISPRRKTGTDI